MKTEKSNWLVRCYDENDEIFSQFEIRDRTEREAQKEAMNDSDVRQSEDWSMMEIGDDDVICVDLQVPKV